MVAISRVFDIEGLWEVLGEVRRNPRSSHDPIDVVNANSPEGRAVGGDAKSTVIREIADSQEEGLTPDENDAPSPEPPDGQEEVIEIIVVDSMADIINELFARKEKSEGISHPFKFNFL